MQKILQILALVAVFMLGSCNYTPSPNEYFSRAVLNTNRINNFGSKEALAILKTDPSVYDEEAKVMKPSSYEDFVKVNINGLEIQYQKVLDLPETDETKDMVNASKDVFSYAIEKQKEVYVNLAKMKDQGATDEELEVAAAEIDNKYAEEFYKKYELLIGFAQPYVQKNGLNVTWGR